MTSCGNGAGNACCAPVLVGAKGGVGNRAVPIGTARSPITAPPGSHRFPFGSDAGERRFRRPRFRSRFRGEAETPVPDLGGSFQVPFPSRRASATRVLRRPRPFAFNAATHSSSDASGAMPSSCSSVAMAYASGEKVGSDARPNRSASPPSSICTSNGDASHRTRLTRWWSNLRVVDVGPLRVMTRATSTSSALSELPRARSFAVCPTWSSRAPATLRALSVCAVWR